MPWYPRKWYNGKWWGRWWGRVVAVVLEPVRPSTPTISATVAERITAFTVAERVIDFDVETIAMIAGNTVRIDATFKNWNDVITDPDVPPTFSAEDGDGDVIVAATVLNIIQHRVSPGVWRYALTLPTDELGLGKVAVYRFSGVLDGEPITRPGRIAVGRFD